MITLSLKDCCYICTCPRLTVDEHTINYGSVASSINAVVSCEHSHVCEMYRHCAERDMNQYNIKDDSTTTLKD